MFFTTLVSAGLTALALSNTAAAFVVRSGDLCKTGPQAKYSALSRNPAAQTYCSSVYGASTIIEYITTTATAGAPTVTVTEVSTAVPTYTANTKRGKCRNLSAPKAAPVYSANSTAHSVPHPTGYSVAQSSSVAKQDDLLFNLASGPSNVAKAACSCLIGAPVTVTATSTAVIYSVATAPAQISGTATVTTVLTVSGTSTTSESTTSATATSSSAEATPTCTSETTTYTTENGETWEITSNSLYGANDSNLLDHVEQPDLNSCLEACAAYSGCQYAFWVADETYGATHQCYYLSNDKVDYGTGFCGINTVKFIAG